jgi:hypothetical protein
LKLLGHRKFAHLPPLPVVKFLQEDAMKIYVNAFIDILQAALAGAHHAADEDASAAIEANEAQETLEKLIELNPEQEVNTWAKSELEKLFPGT